MEEGFLVIDKPQGWTSHDVVAKVRNILGIRKIGHLGTLDPISTGVLVLAVGRKYTKQVQDYMGVDKEYEAEMELGKVSDTYDAEGKVEETGVALDFSESQIKLAMEPVWGTTMQVPPAFSATKVKGRRAYNMARAGEKVELKPREVTMEAWDIQWDPPFVRFKVKVSSGTYVRALIHDIGQALGCGAVMTALRRTRVGEFTLDQAKTILQLSES